MLLPETPGFRLEGKRALVTGAGRGIGLAASAALAEAGAHVTLVARNSDEIEEAASAIRAKGGTAVADRLDVLDLSALEKFFSGREAFQILVNNAGTNRPKPLLDVDEGDYHAVMDLNLKAAYFVSRFAVRRMVDEGVAGSLIHMGSQMGHVGAANRSLYCASKWALEGMSQALAVELGSYGIRSNTIAPTFIETPMTRPYLEDAGFREAVIGKIKLGRLGRVEDIMGGIVFLASDASSLVTGTSLVIDGGWTAD